MLGRMRSLTLAVAFVAVGLVGCASLEGNAGRDGQAGEAAGASEVKEVKPLPDVDETLAKTAGTWVENDDLRVYVAHEPILRVYVIERKDAPGSNPLLIPDHNYGGIRTCMMDPVQTINWDLASLTPAKVVESRDGYLHVRGEVQPEAMAQQEMIVELGDDDAGRPAVTLTHRLINRADRPREMAAWSLASLVNGGVLRTEYARQKNVMWDRPMLVRSVGLFDAAVAEEPSFTFGEQAVTIDSGEAMGVGSAKLGVLSTDGTVQFKTDAATWTSTGPAAPTTDSGEPDFSAEANDFPEGGYNVTFYKSWRPEDLNWHYTELEHVAPLETLAPGEASELVQTIVVE